MNTNEADADVYLELHRIMNEESKDKNPKPMKYIDAEKLIAKLRRQKHELELSIQSQGDYGQSCQIVAYENILSIITSLQQEQPEVDLEKELDQWRHKHFKGKRDGDYSGEYLERKSQLDLARHFCERGQSTQYQKDRAEFAKLKAKEWQKGFDEGLNARNEE